MAEREPSSEKSAGLFCRIRASACATDVLRFLLPSPCASNPRSSSSPSSACSFLAFCNASSSRFFSKPETISHRAVMMPLLFAPLSKQRPIQRRGGTRKNSLIYKRALAHAVPRSGRNKRNAHSNGHPAFCASKEVMEKKSGSSASIKSTGNRTKSASKYLATTCARSGERW